MTLLGFEAQLREEIRTQKMKRSLNEDLDYVFSPQYCLYGTCPGSLRVSQMARWGGIEENRVLDSTHWRGMKSQQKPLGGSVVCGRSSAVSAAATVVGAEPGWEPWPLLKGYKCRHAKYACKVSGWMRAIPEPDAGVWPTSRGSGWS